MVTQKQPLIGAHVSAAGGIFNAIEKAEQIGADTIQIFGSSPRQWNVRIPADDVVARYTEALKKSRVKKVFLHAPYLINLASQNPVDIEKSIEALAGHLAIAEKIHAEGLIFHVGSGKEMPKGEAIGVVADAMKKILEKVPGKSQLIIENSAGGGQKLCSDPEEFKIIMDEVASSRVKACYDTAHGFEAGTIESYSVENIKKLFDRWDASVGIENIVALHVNDSKTVYNSHHDRHENIGHGHIGLEGFANLAREKRLCNTSWILEVPGFADQGPDEKNIDILRSLF